MTAAALPPDPCARRARRPEPETPDPDRTALDERISPAQVVEIYRAAEADIRLGFSLVAGAVRTLTERVAGRYSIAIYDRSHTRSSIDFDDPEPSLRHLRREIWRGLVERTQVRKLMSVAAWKELDEQLRNDEPPEVTIDNLQGLINRIQNDGPKMLEAAVVEVFEFLRPPPRQRAAYKTNTEFELGARVILSGWIERWDRLNHVWRMNHRYEQEARALENVFRLMEGRVRSADDRYRSELQDAINACTWEGDCVGETEYLAFKGHKNGTLHLRFKRMDLVRKLNVIAGGARLKPITVDKE